MSLEEIAQTTRIPLRMLQHIEQDQLDALPGDVFTRGFLKSYARSVGIPPETVLARYGQRESVVDTAPAPMTAITPPEKGKRFGIAIALVILLILFTLALSIVLRPRERDRAIELSQRAPAAQVDSAIS